MKAVINKFLVIAVLGMGLVACSKEEVKPFTPGGSNISNLNTRSSNGNMILDEVDVEKQKGATSNEDPGVTTNEEGSNITDGGTSSDYDSKGSKRKPSKN